MASVKGAICAIRIPIILARIPTGLCRLPLQRLASRADTEADGTRAAIARTYQLGSARLTVAGRRNVSCRLLDQQVSRLKQELEMDDGFHRTPLVHGRLKALQYVLPRAVGAAQYLLSNEPNSFGCAAQYDRWARADTQLWIDWKVGHGLLTPGCSRSSMRRGNEIVRGNSFRTAQSARKYSHSVAAKDPS